MYHNPLIGIGYDKKTIMFLQNICAVPVTPFCGQVLYYTLGKLGLSYRGEVELGIIETSIHVLAIHKGHTLR